MLTIGLLFEIINFTLKEVFNEYHLNPKFSHQFLSTLYERKVLIPEDIEEKNEIILSC